jgi:NAD-dependent deacetylase
MSDRISEKKGSIRQASQLIKKTKAGVVFTGAGISTPSGIPDFRSEGSGLWTRYLPMEVASLTAFRHNPDRFFSWLRPLASRMLSAQPNPAHTTIAELQNEGYFDTVITQNIDGLHHRAGSINILEIHGTFNTLSCVGCYKQYESNPYIRPYIEEGQIPQCFQCGSILNPDVILFEEQLPMNIWMRAEQISKQCDLMLVAGTSLEVIPSAKLPLYAVENSAKLIVVNNTDTYIDIRADVVIRGDVADILPLIAQEIIGD